MVVHTEDKCVQRLKLRAITWVIGVMLTLFALGLSAGASIVGCTAAKAANTETDVAVIKSQYAEVIRRLKSIEDKIDARTPPSGR